MKELFIQLSGVSRFFVERRFVYHENEPKQTEPRGEKVGKFMPLEEAREPRFKIQAKGAEAVAGAKELPELTPNPYIAAGRDSLPKIEPKPFLPKEVPHSLAWQRRKYIKKEAERLAVKDLADAHLRGENPKLQDLIDAESAILKTAEERLAAGKSGKNRPALSAKPEDMLAALFPEKPRKTIEDRATEVVAMSGDPFSPKKIPDVTTKIPGYKTLIKPDALARLKKKGASPAALAAFEAAYEKGPGRGAEKVASIIKELKIPDRNLANPETWNTIVGKLAEDPVFFAAYQKRHPESQLIGPSVEEQGTQVAKAGGEKKEEEK